MPNPADVSLPSTQGVAAPYFANYVKDQLVRQYGPSRAYGGGLKVTTTLDPNLQSIAREAIVIRAHRSERPDARRSSRSTRTRGAVLAMVGGQNYHQSQFNLATQGERQPGSAVQAVRARDGAAEGHRTVDRAHVEAGDDRRRRPPLAGQQLRGRVPRADRPDGGDRVLRQLGVLAADRDRRAERASARRPGTSGSRRRSGRYFAIGLGAEPATPLEMARAYGSIRRRRLPPRRLDLRQRAARDREGRSTRRATSTMNGVTPHQVLDARTRRRPSTSCCRASSATAPARAAALPGRRSPARPARPRTTATPGSSATRRRSSPRSGSATRTSSSRCRPSSTGIRSPAARSRR